MSIKWLTEHLFAFRFNSERNCGTRSVCIDVRRI